METLSVSRMEMYLQCNRKHYYGYEVGLEQMDKPHALRFGSAWARAMEARREGQSFQDTLRTACSNVEEVDELDVATIGALLAGYYLQYKTDALDKIHPEIAITTTIKYNRNFQGIAILDGLGTLPDGRHAMLEDKTTSSSVEPASEYWQRLRYNNQVFGNVDAARQEGWDVETVVYDVTRKPSIRPKESIPELDDVGRKIVLNVDGERVFKKDTLPRESGDSKKGYTVKTRRESVEEYGDRLAKDCQERPEFYYARREVPVLASDIEEFIASRDAVARQIINHRKEEERYTRKEYAWPRTCGRDTCNLCAFGSFCLQSAEVDKEHIPSGFKLKE